MARTFDGVDDRCLVAIGAMTHAFGPGTMAAIVKKSSDGTVDTIMLPGVAASPRYGMRFSSTNVLEYIYSSTVVSAPAGIDTCLVADGWLLVAVTKASGTVAVRFHRYEFATGVWQHANSAGTAPNSTPPATSINFGTDHAGNNPYAGDMEITGGWNVVLSDAQIESLPFNLSYWQLLSPKGLWLFDQASTGQKVLDVSGNGANESSLTGTVVSSSSVPIFSRGHKIRYISGAAGGPFDATPSVGNLLYTGIVPTVVASNHKNSLANTGIVSYTGVAPTVQTPRVMSTAKGSVLYAGLAPVVATPRNILAAKGTLSYVGLEPTVLTPRVILANVGIVSYTGFVPVVDVTEDLNVAANKGTVTYTGIVPTVNVSDHKNVLAGWGQASYTGYLPTVAAINSINILPGKGDVTYTGRVPTVNAGIGAVANTGTVSYVGKVPTISTSNNAIVNANVGVVTVTGQVPLAIASNHKNILPFKGVLTYTGYPPATDASVSIPTNTGILSYNGFSPSVTVTSPFNALTSTGILFYDGKVPTFSATQNLNVSANKGNVTYAGSSPDISVSNHVSIPLEKGTLLFDGYSPTINVTPIINTQKGSVIYTGYSPLLSGMNPVSVECGKGMLIYTGYRGFTGDAEEEFDPFGGFLFHYRTNQGK